MLKKKDLKFIKSYSLTKMKYFTLFKITIIIIIYQIFVAKMIKFLIILNSQIVNNEK